MACDFAKRARFGEVPYVGVHFREGCRTFLNGTAHGAPRRTTPADREPGETFRPVAKVCGGGGANSRGPPSQARIATTKALGTGQLLVIELVDEDPRPLPKPQPLRGNE